MAEYMANLVCDGAYEKEHAELGGCAADLGLSFGTAGAWAWLGLPEGLAWLEARPEAASATLPACTACTRAMAPWTGKKYFWVDSELLCLKVPMTMGTGTLEVTAFMVPAWLRLWVPTLLGLMPAASASALIMCSVGL